MRPYVQSLLVVLLLLAACGLPGCAAQTPTAAPRVAQVAHVNVGDAAYTLPLTYPTDALVLAVGTPAGIAWIAPQPTTGSGTQRRPTAPAMLYLTPARPGGGDLDTGGQLLATLPFTVQEANLTKEITPTELRAAGDWVVIISSRHLAGAAQSQVRIDAVNLQTKVMRFVTNGEATGGMSFKYKVEPGRIIWEQRRAMASGDALVESMAMDLASGTKTPVPEGSATGAGVRAPSELPRHLTVPRLYAITDQVAWVLAIEGIYRSTDGGVTWSDVTPPQRGTMVMPAALFPNPQTAWIVAHPGPPDGGKGTLLRTSDGRRTWNAVEIPFQEGDLAAVDTQHAFALVTTAVGAGSSSAVLYRTTDGGTTWSRVNSSDPPTEQGLPYGGIKDGIAFRTPMVGWLAGETYAMGQPYLFVTHDAGQTWREQPLTLPAECRQEQVRVGVPQFAGDLGHLLLQCFGPQGQVKVLTYASRDGGSSWQSLPPLQVPASGSLWYSFADASHGWLAVPTPNQGTALFSTQDGGQTWRSLGAQMPPTGAPAIQFTSPAVGWALSFRNDGPVLLRTTDGGQTWHTP